MQSDGQLRAQRRRSGRLFYFGGRGYHRPKRAAEQNRFLLREVNHRAKNLLAVVQAVARQTAGENDPKVFAERFAARLSCLAACQDLLVRSNWRGVSAGELVRSQLAHFVGLVGTRILLDGPTLRLSAAAAQTIGMALHELATNAGKHGALSDAQGIVEVTWNLAGSDEAPEFVMCWHERNGPRVAPPERRGFGHTVIVRMVEHALDAAVSLEHDPAGLVWRMSAPAQLVLDPPSNLDTSGDGSVGEP
ncbi:MAG TPA: HWE histidine kinase domain-containing protein [Hyphomicrobiaceae bacterium]